MASTYTFWDVSTMTGDAVSSAAEAAKAPMACNLAFAHIWKAFPWRQSLGELPPFYLVPGKQNYGAPAVSVPSDFLGLNRAYYVNRNNLGGNWMQELKCLADIAHTDQQDYPQIIGYEGSTQTFRIWPRPMNNMAAPYHLIEGEYKKVPTFTLISTGATANKITSNNMDDALIPFDDMYIGVMVEAVKWAFYSLNSDMQRAGGKQIQNGIVSQWGQFAVMNAAIQEMATNEGLELGPAVAGPSESLYDSFWAWNT